MFHWSNSVKKLCKVERSWRYWRGLLIEECVCVCVFVCVCVCVCVRVCVEREREGEAGERSANYVGLLRSKLCGITVLKSLMQYSWLVLYKSLLCECKCSKISNFRHNKFLNLIISTAAFLITSFLAQLNQFVIFFRYIKFLVFLYEFYDKTCLQVLPKSSVILHTFCWHIK